jgi:hypothetical protein
MHRWRVFLGGFGLLVLAQGCPSGAASPDPELAHGGTGAADQAEAGTKAGKGGTGTANNQVPAQGGAPGTGGRRAGADAGKGAGQAGQNAGAAAHGGAGGQTGTADDDAGAADETCPGNVPLPAICRVCGDGSCGKPVCKAGKPTGEYRCPSQPAVDCNCTKGAFVPVCGTDGKDYDAACGMSCVPVAVACQGKCPCQAQSAGACVVGGCSNQLCTEASAGTVVSTCEWREEYACYRSATCARQSTGKCGWTQTPELTACLKNPGAQK